MKSGRQAVILQIITEESIETQQQLLEALARHGYKATQATLSRDIKELHLVKGQNKYGTYQYIVSGKMSNTDSEQRLKKIFRESVLECDTAQNIFVIKTLPGLASAACSAIDNIKDFHDIVGTIAGDDTAFIALRSSEAAEKMLEEIQQLIG